MNITYLGHSCFLLQNAQNKRLIIDPFYDVGYSFDKVDADIVVASHRHYDHFDLTNVCGNYKIIEKENCELNGFTITSYKSFHDTKKGALRGENYIHKIVCDNVSICHMGDYGEGDNSVLPQEIIGVDVLLIPVGGTYTVNSLEAFNLVKRINPKYVIPMHYKTKSCNINIESENKFLSYFLKEQISYVNKTVQYPLPNKVTVINF